MDLNLLKYKYRHADRGRVVRKHLLCYYVIPAPANGTNERDDGFRARKGERRKNGKMKNSLATEVSWKFLRSFRFALTLARESE